MQQTPVILIVDDEPFNVSVLEQELDDLGYSTVSAQNGQEALEIVAAQPPDLVLLDVMMPILDGFEVLSRLKSSAATIDIPVIVISAMSDIGSVVKGIEQGAEDYLPKPFDSVLLAARVGACLEKKRLRDLERAYLDDVERLTQAAISVEGNDFEPASLEAVAERSDALGGLARVFQRMAQEVRAREQRLTRQLQQALQDQEERAQSAHDSVSVYIPMDRRIAISHGETLSEVAYGACLVVDVSGFTRLSEALSAKLGANRGAEELIRNLNVVFGALIEQVHRFRGSVVSFSGDAMTCWFEGDNGRRAVASALAMQNTMTELANVATPGGTDSKLAIKTAVAAGKAMRYVIGNPEIQTFDVLAGRPLVEMALAEKVAKRGQVIVPRTLVEQSGTGITAAAWRTDLETGQQFAVVTSVIEMVVAEPWEPLPSGSVSDDAARQWVLPAVFDRVRRGNSEFLAELRPAAAMFLGFEGIEYESDSHAKDKLNAFVGWVQGILKQYDGTVLQVTIGDKGSYLYAVFGAPVMHEDDPIRAVGAALELQSRPSQFGSVTETRIGIAYGEMRSGSYGGPAQRTFGVQGSQANLAAYLMQHASDGILCDESIYRLARSKISFDVLPPIPAKKGSDVIPVFRPNVTSLQSAISSRLDQLTASAQLTLKVASVIGQTFAVRLLQDVYPVESATHDIDEHLAAAEQLGFILAVENGHEPSFTFTEQMIRDQAYDLLLFAQRRGIHESIAHWYERTYESDLGQHYAELAHHWQAAGDTAKSSAYLELAGTQAMGRGETEAASQYFRAALQADD